MSKQQVKPSALKKIQHFHKNETDWLSSIFVCGSASDPLYLEGEPSDELIRKRNQVLRPHRRLGQSGIHQEDLDGHLGLLLCDTSDTPALPAVVDAHSDKRPDYAAPTDSVVVIVLRIQIFPDRIWFQEF